MLPFCRHIFHHLMRQYYFWKSKLSKEEKESRKELFGSFKEGFYPLEAVQLET